MELPGPDYHAPAKLNLFLHVVGRREDGYHLLQSVFTLIDRCDRLRFRVRDDGLIRRVNDVAGVAPEQDLAVRAARLLQEASGTGMGAEIELEKLISDSLYLDNQAHAVVARMRDMDSGTKSQLRRLYNAVRRAVRAPENERQHQFVMLRARLAYTIARHSLRSLDALERLLLQVTRRNDARGYERFKDLFEAIVAYNE